MRCSPLLPTFIVLLLCSFAVPRIVRSLVLKSSAQTCVSFIRFKFALIFGTFLVWLAASPKALIPRYSALFACFKTGSKPVAARALRHWLSPRPLSSLTYLLVLVSVRPGIGALKGQRALSKRTARKRVSFFRQQYAGIIRPEPPLPHGLYNRSGPKRLLTLRAYDTGS